MIEKHIHWTPGLLRLLDQTLLPVEERVVECRSVEEVAQAIRDMVVRGAPAIGAVAGFGLAIGAQTLPEEEEAFFAQLEEMAQLLRRTRPTAINLFWAIERMLSRARSLRGEGVAKIRDGLVAEAEALAQEDVATNQGIGQMGLPLIPQGAGVLTHCNAGALATMDYGTALGVIRAAHEAGKGIHVYADETRPFLQGARLTTYELMRDGIPVTLITDNMAGWVMAQGKVQVIIVGADRITAKGDVANKIGTYSLAVLAARHKIPFLVAAPLSTFDLSLSDGKEIPIEERDPKEVVEIFGKRIAPQGVGVYNPAFDVTPAELVTAIVTEKQVIYPPYTTGIQAVFS